MFCATHGRDRLVWRQHKKRTAPALALFSTISCAWGVSPENLIGLSLEEGLNEFESTGLRIFYSSDLVRSSMQIETAPVGEDDVELLGNMLALHGLTLHRGLNNTWLVVRARRSDTITDESVAASLDTELADSHTIETPLEELIVAASQYEISRAQTVSRQFIGSRDLEHMPDIGDDVIRTVARLPGIASNGFSALSHFRGGELNETLVRFDGLRLYDPFHLRDFQSVFSAIDPRIVSSMEIYTGGFPATYGDRMSGVIDIQSMNVEENAYHEIGASFFNSSLLSSGRFAEQSGEWVLSLRRSNLDILYDRFSDQPDRPRYADLYARLGFEISDSLSITANVLRAEDEISLADDEDREEEASADQSDSYEWLRLDHSLGGRTSGSTLLARTRLESSRINGTTSKTGVSSGQLEDIRSFTLTTLQSDWSRLLGNRMLLDFGGSVTRMRGRYNYSDNADFDVLFDVEGTADRPNRTRQISRHPHGRQYSLYSTLRFDWNPRVATEFGVRWNRQSIDGLKKATVGPRLGFRYAISASGTLRAGWGRFYQSQSINELQVSDGVRDFFPPQQSDQIVVGFDRLLTNGAVIRIEAYQKKMSGLRPRFENILNARVLLPELKPDRIRIDPERATARGLEITINGGNGSFQWWGSVSRSRVTDMLRGRDIRRSWDQKYSFSAGLHWETDKWTFSSALAWRSGWPTSSIVTIDQSAFPTVTAPGRNDTRLADFRSLDVRLSREYGLEKSALSLFVEVANVTGRNNPCCIEFEIGDEEDAGQFVLDELGYLKTIPSIGFLWKF